MRWSKVQDRLTTIHEADLGIHRTLGTSTVYVLIQHYYKNPGRL